MVDSFYQRKIGHRKITNLAKINVFDRMKKIFSKAL